MIVFPARVRNASIRDASSCLVFCCRILVDRVPIDRPSIPTTRICAPGALVTGFPGLMVMAYRCPAHRFLFHVNLFLFFAPRLFSMPGFFPMCTYCPSTSFNSVRGFLWLALLRSESWKSPRCVSNSRVNLLSVLRPRPLFRALILFRWFPDDFLCPDGSFYMLCSAKY